MLRSTFGALYVCTGVGTYVLRYMHRYMHSSYLMYHTRTDTTFPLHTTFLVSKLQPLGLTSVGAFLNLKKWIRYLNFGHPEL